MNVTAMNYIRNSEYSDIIENKYIVTPPKNTNCEKKIKDPTIEEKKNSSSIKTIIVQNLTPLHVII